MVSGGTVCYAPPKRHIQPPVERLGVKVPRHVRQLHGLACIEGTTQQGTQIVQGFGVNFFQIRAVPMACLSDDML